MVHSHSSQAEIARRLKRHPATISRELRRNRSPNGYWASAAQAKADARRSDRPWTCKMDRPEVASYVRERLRQRWSPDEIAGRSRDEFPRDSHRRVSRQTIYTWIHTHRAAAYWRRYLRRLGRVRRRGEKRGQLPACVSIEGRPAVVDRRTRYGDWEGDTVVGRGASRRRRHAGGPEIGLHADGQGQSTGERRLFVKQWFSLFQPLPARLRKTLTLDNGKEFAEHEQLAAATALHVYFAKPYCAWQRGTNENTNGLVRQFFPKGTDMTHVPAKQFEKVQHLLNNRPRKRLGYQTPLEVLTSRLRCD